MQSCKCFNYATAGDCAVNYATAGGVVHADDLPQRSGLESRSGVKLLTCLLDRALTGLSIISTRDFTSPARGHQSARVGSLPVPTGRKSPLKIA